MLKICKICNKEFEAKNYNQNYCSKKCRDIAVTRYCENCGKEFKVSKPSVQTKFCSKSCAISMMNKLKLAGTGSKKNKNKKKVKLKCSYCGKEFEKIQSEYATIRNEYFCSKECYNNKNLAITKSKEEKDTTYKCEYCGKEMPVNYRNRKAKFCSEECYGKSKQKRNTFICEHCGKEFSKPPSQTSEHNFCSQECYLAYIKRPLETNKDLKKAIRGSSQYKQWKNKVFEKDDNKCIICGNNEKLHAHHIIPLSNIVDPYINSANENNIEELLNNILNDSVFNNINNGVSLCEKCHYKCHNLGFKK